jgi:hypothetical protein
MVDSSTPHGTAAAVLAALDAQRWSDVAARCAEAPLAELRDSVATFIESLHQHRFALPDEIDPSAVLREYGDDLADAAALRALTPRAFLVRHLSRPEMIVPSTGPRTMGEVSLAGDHAVVKYRRPGTGSQELRLVRSAGEWRVLLNDDILPVVRLSPALWRRRFEAGA